MNTALHSTESKLWFDWNRKKAHANQKRHRIRFEAAERIFDDPACIDEPDPASSFDEQRWLAIGMAERHFILSVAYTWRKGQTDKGEEVEYRWLISARYADRKERAWYEKQRRSTYT